MSKKLIMRSYPKGTNASKAIVASKFGGVEIDYPSDFNMGVDNKTPEFLKKHPLGQVPLLETPEGPIFESNAIARYVSRIGNKSAQLLGSTAYEQSVIDQWIDFVNNNIMEGSFYLYGHVFGWTTFNQEKFDENIAKQKKGWAALESSLNNKGTTFLISNTQPSLADIILGCTLAVPCTYALDTAFRASYPKVEHLLKTLYATPEFVSGYMDVKMIDAWTPPK